MPWWKLWQPAPVSLPGEYPWTEEPGRLQSMGSQNSWTQLSDGACMHTVSSRDWEGLRCAEGEQRALLEPWRLCFVRTLNTRACITENRRLEASSAGMCLLRILEAGSLRWECQLGWFLLLVSPRPAHGCCLLSVSSHSLSSVSFCVKRSLSYKDTSHNGSVLLTWPHFLFIFLFIYFFFYHPIRQVGILVP